ncbi:MAG TPA: hypothetical protein VNK24_07275 [Elusimicrobiota bacterium]|nr:hypothetical protein [Elusimicrobiota bacterium]
MLKAYLGVARSHRGTLSFGIPLAFFSSLGQTFLISLRPAAPGAERRSLLALAGSSPPWGLVVFLSLAGVSQGLGGAFKIAVWAELYPLERLGEVRSAAGASV